MTDRLYYTDAYLPTFTATVVEVADGRVYLDRSAFYPTSGGQPHDLGVLAGARITDVVDEDARIAHLVADASGFTVGMVVEGTIDWERRFDFMQQHTAQHLLSAICADRHGSPTTSVHFGVDYCTVDITAPAVDAATLVAIEEACNREIFADRDVRVTFEDAATATGLRKPSDRAGALRIVAIDGIDRSACGGTHVRRTGEIGALVLRRTEKMKGGTRIEFLAGMRTVRRARADRELLASVARPLSAAPEELPTLVEAQLASLRAAEKELRALRTSLAGYEAKGLFEAAPAGSDGIRRIALPRQAGGARDAEPLATAVAALGRAIVLVTGAAPPSVLLTTSPDSGADAGALVKGALAAVGGRGGGSPRTAQGSVPDADALARADEALRTLAGFGKVEAGANRVE